MVERSNSRHESKLFLEEIGGVFAISWRHRLVSIKDQIRLPMLDQEIRSNLTQEIKAFLRLPHYPHIRDFMMRFASAACNDLSVSRDLGHPFEKP